VGIRSENPGRTVRPATRSDNSIEVLLVRELEPDLGRRCAAGKKDPRRRAHHFFGEGDLEAQVEGRGGMGLRLMRFTSRTGFHEALARLGHIPLPPYIKRADEPLDRERYQTVYARQGSRWPRQLPGFTSRLKILKRVRERGVEIAEITLDVGARNV